MGNDMSTKEPPKEEGPDLRPQGEYRQIYRQWRVGSPAQEMIPDALTRRLDRGPVQTAPGSPLCADSSATSGGTGRPRTFSDVGVEKDDRVESPSDEHVTRTSPRMPHVWSSPSALKDIMNLSELSVNDRELVETYGITSLLPNHSSPRSPEEDTKQPDGLHPPKGGSPTRVQSANSRSRNEIRESSSAFHHSTSYPGQQAIFGYGNVNSSPLPPHPPPVLSKSLNRHDSQGSMQRVPRSISTNDLQDLSRIGYFPAQPRSAETTQKSLKVSVIEDMCRAVAKQMVGDVHIESRAPNGQVRRVVNHLYPPVYAAVQKHFKQLPARYALSVNPDEVSMHMKLLTELQRAPDNIAVHCRPNKGDDGSTVEGGFDVTICCKDQDNLLDSITRSLKAMRGKILDADVMTTTSGIALDRFIVQGDFAGKDKLKELKSEILRRLKHSEMSATPPHVEPMKAPSPPQRQGGTASHTSFASLSSRNMKPEWEIDFDEIVLGVPIGAGRSGQTYVAQWRGKRVAAKVVNVGQQGDVGEEILSELYREVEVVSTLRHPNICLFLGAAAKPPTYCLVFEFMEGGTLTSLLRTTKGPVDFFRLATEIAQGMNYLHLCHIIHRDLKSGNLLLDKHGTVKISDFGLSCVFASENSGEMTAETGTYRWMAPEVIRHEPYSSKADVYSYGIVLWELITKEQPFKGMTPIQAAFSVARQNMRPALPSYTPAKVGALIEHCWHGNPAFRPSFAELLETLPVIAASLTRKELMIMGMKK